MKKQCLISLLILWMCSSGTAAAQTDVDATLGAIVRVRATVPETARSAARLGLEREGNGVAIDAKGHVLTIGYLILEAAEVEITGGDGQAVQASVVGYDHHTGFGLLKAARPLKVPVMELGDSARLAEGEPLVVAGYGGRQAAQGVRVVSLSEFAGAWEYLLDRAIFIAPSYDDYGGAALIDRRGRLVGIGSLISQVNIAGLGLLAANMFVPIDLLKPILADLISSGRPEKSSRPWLGIRSEEIHGRVFVLGVSSDGPSEKAGIRPGDLVLAVKEKPVTGLADFYRQTWALGPAGVEVPLQVLQGLVIRTIVVRSADRQEQLRFNTRQTTFHMKRNSENTKRG
ncbi:MAG: S1C family serine protease [Desulfobacterales bacterium]|nr:S1C family serine protease [Desulfobacterales bacterium]